MEVKGYAFKSMSLYIPLPSIARASVAENAFSVFIQLSLKDNNKHNYNQKPQPFYSTGMHLMKLEMRPAINSVLKIAKATQDYKSYPKQSYTVLSTKRYRSIICKLVEGVLFPTSHIVEIMLILTWHWPPGVQG